MPDLNLVLFCGLGVLVGAFIFGRSSKQEDKLRPQKPITQNVLDYTAALGLLLAIVFWGTFYFSVFRPDLMKWPWSLPWWIIAVLLGIVHTMALPLLFSLTLPNDPVNALLQDHKRHTWGFMAQVASVVTLAIISAAILMGWMNASGTTVGESGYGNWIAIILGIITVVVPNLAWQQAIPANWKWQIEQSFEIQKMRRRHAAELMMMSAHHVKAIGDIMVDTNQATVDHLPKIAREYARFMGSMYRRINGEMKGMGYLLSAVAGAQDVRIPQLRDEEVQGKFRELQDMMQRGLELEVEERERQGMSLRSEY